MTQYCDGYDYVGNGIFTVEIVEQVAAGRGIDNAVVGEIEPRMSPWVSTSGEVNWNCQFGNTATANLKYLPSTCRGGNTP